MSVNLPSHYVIQYSTNVQLLLQTKGSKLRPYVTTASYVGKQASPVDQIAAIEAQRVTQRFAPMGRVDAAVDRRWVFPVDYDLPQQIDQFDKLRMLTDPESSYVQNAVYAMGRAQDDEIISAFFGTAKTGETGGTSTSFLSANAISVNTGGTNSLINVAKLRAAKKLLMSYEVDLDNDPIFCAIPAADHDALLNEIQIISSDFNGADKPVLQDGKVSRFLGINFIHAERLESKATGTDDQSHAGSVQIPIWAKSGMHMGIWNDMETAISRREDIQGRPWQAYVAQTIGATRVEEKKIVKAWSYR